ncbi:phage head spike fiber domain-containing protein [Sphingobacterium cavernae]|uniref:phage head spike fiber domain-containing protein n=1 Tax=Sphingobacterium cavernae TaxID=2592657 RepID=UPI00122FC0E7|nr:hypothetical protein [Sphingobacterium cavernae]
MAGIVTSNKTRKLVGNRLKEIDVPTTTLNTALYYADLTAQGAAFTAARVNAELNAYPTVVKNNASLALTPSANKAGVVYAMNGDSKTLEEFEFQRGSSGTYFDASGVMQLAAANVPRINFENGVSKGLMIEPASSNLSTDSGFVNGLSSSSPKSSVGLTAVDTNFNLGSFISKGLRLEHNSNEAVYAYKGFVFSLGLSYTFSFFIKMDDGSAPILHDLRIVIQGVAITAGVKILNIGNNVYRIQATHVGIESSLQYFGIAKFNTNSTKSFVATGFQLEEGPVATSYIPTTTAIATRLADKVLSKRPTVVFPKNSLNVKTAEWPATWMGNGVDNRNIAGRNLLKNSNSSSLFIGSGGSTVTPLGSVSVSEWSANNAQRVTTTGGTVVTKAVNSLAVPAVGEKVSVSFWVKNNHQTNNLLVRSNLESRSVTLTPGQQLKVEWLSIEGNGVGSVQVQFRATDVSHNIDATFWRIKLEKGATLSSWQPAPEDYIKVDENGNIEISYTEPIHLQQFSLISRELSQEEV